MSDKQDIKDIMKDLQKHDGWKIIEHVLSERKEISEDITLNKNDPDMDIAKYSEHSRERFKRQIRNDLLLLPDVIIQPPKSFMEGKTIKVTKRTGFIKRILHKLGIY